VGCMYRAPPAVRDLYGPVLANVLFPAFEALRGRPTIPLLRQLQTSQWWSIDRLREQQLGQLRRLLRHAHAHTRYYRKVLDERGLSPEVPSLESLQLLPLLDRPTLMATLDDRTTDAPPFVSIVKGTSGSSGAPVTVKYNAESRHWRDATRWRGYGWGGYQIGKRALHYWGMTPPSKQWHKQTKVAIDRAFKRDLYIDCTPRGDDALQAVVRAIETFKPEVIVAYAAGAAALARFIVAQRLRTWRDIPILLGAERVWPNDRELMEQAFGPVFETYGCREVMMIASECDAHAGMHESMETMIVELLVRDANGTVRTAKPGETGEVAITDLHNLACPMIRYVNGDLAVARAYEPCPCGRGLARLGPIDGRVTETLRDGQGRAVGGLVFNILLGVIEHAAKQFQVVQKLDGSVVMKVVPMQAGALIPDAARAEIDGFAAKYLPGAPFTIEYVDDIPLSAAGKRRVVVVERPENKSDLISAQIAH